MIVRPITKLLADSKTLYACAGESIYNINFEKNKVVAIWTDADYVAEDKAKTHVSNQSRIDMQDQNSWVGDMVTCGDDIAAVFNNKLVRLMDGVSLCEKEKWTLEKRASVMQYQASTQLLWIADKFGDVWSISLKTEELTFPILQLGHVSMILDLQVMETPCVIITADRDEHIRVTRYPDTYNIQTYLLGHTSFVTKLCVYNNNTLISGGGDRQLRVWALDTGRCLSIEQTKDTRPIAGIKLIHKKIVVWHDESHKLFIYDMGDCNLLFDKSLEIDGQIYAVDAATTDGFIYVATDSRPYAKELVYWISCADLRTGMLKHDFRFLACKKDEGGCH